MSTHSVNIIEIGEVLPHDNAERLEIVPVGGWRAVVKKGQFTRGDRAVYIEPDYTVPTTHPDFAFLAREGRDRHRFKAVRLRGVRGMMWSAWRGRSGIWTRQTTAGTGMTKQALGKSDTVASPAPPSPPSPNHQ